MQSIAQDLLDFRRDYELTQEQAAAIFQVSVTSLSRWERGLRTPPYRGMQALRAKIELIDKGSELWERVNPR